MVSKEKYTHAEPQKIGRDENGRKNPTNSTRRANALSWKHGQEMRAIKYAPNKIL